MIRAVFFDLYHTLVTFEPPREEIQAGVMREMGIEIEADALKKPLVAADEFIYAEMAKRSLGKRSDAERMSLWVEYQRVLLREAGVALDDEKVLRLLGMMRQATMNLVLFDDVKPLFAELKGRGILTGLISNVDSDIEPLLAKVGMPHLSVVMTSDEAGYSKPNRQIFEAALKKAGVAAGESLYVGDQYNIDVVGALSAGITGVLLDRGGFHGDAYDCPCIRSLVEITGLLD